jgi:hypothetical protein
MGRNTLMGVGMLVGAAWLWVGLWVYGEFNPTPPPAVPECTPEDVPVYIITERSWPL